MSKMSRGKHCSLRSMRGGWIHFLWERTRRGRGMQSLRRNDENGLPPLQWYGGGVNLGAAYIALPPQNGTQSFQRVFNW